MLLPAAVIIIVKSLYFWKRQFVKPVWGKKGGVFLGIGFKLCIAADLIIDEQMLGIWDLS